MTEYKTRRALANVNTAVHHQVALPPCCPITGNPLAGSMLTISYRPAGIVFPVETLTDMVAEYVNGHKTRNIREMEEMIQDIALRVSAVTKTRCRARADLVIKPPYGGDHQRLIVTAIGRVTGAEVSHA